MKTINVFNFTNEDVVNYIPFAEQYAFAPINLNSLMTLNTILRDTRSMLDNFSANPLFDKNNETIVIIKDNLHYWLAALMILIAFRNFNNDIKLWISGYKRGHYIDTQEWIVEGNDFSQMLFFLERNQEKIDVGSYLLGE